MITNLDSPNKRPARTHISVRDLVRSGLQVGKKNSDEHGNSDLIPTVLFSRSSALALSAAPQQAASTPLH
jgi:hypothetical protein